MKKIISIVVPVFNEEQNVLPMYEALMKAWKNISEYACEIIFVDDGSADGTWSKISDVAKTSNFVTGIRFARNFGHQSAIEAGLKRASGKAVITMDGDLQHPPELIPIS